MSTKKQIEANRKNAKSSREKALKRYYENPNICPNCKEIIKIKSKISQTRRQKFCSQSCANSFTNKTHPKRKPEGKCKTCKEPILTMKTYCQVCVKNLRGLRNEKTTLGDVCRRNDAGIYSNVRYHSREIYKKSKLPSECFICKYNKHVQICHRKAIKDFDMETLLTVVNDLNNLLALCPNCHWEFDHGLLKIP